jgi:hypothetical protein
VLAVYEKSRNGAFSERGHVQSISRLQKLREQLEESRKIAKLFELAEDTEDLSFQRRWNDRLEGIYAEIRQIENESPLLITITGGN